LKETAFPHWDNLSSKRKSESEQKRQKQQVKQVRTSEKEKTKVKVNQKGQKLFKAKFRSKDRPNKRQFHFLFPFHFSFQFRFHFNCIFHFNFISFHFKVSNVKISKNCKVNFHTPILTRQIKFKHCNSRKKIFQNPWSLPFKMIRDLLVPTRRKPTGKWSTQDFWRSLLKGSCYSYLRQLREKLHQISNSAPLNSKCCINLSRALKPTLQNTL
jgi:hypothetical protein